MNNSAPLVSVAIATFNGEKYLREQLDSIFRQTYKNVEVVVSDDCSTDKTVNILEEYRCNYGLRYSRNEKNLGFVQNFERAIAMCQGEYIALCDQDDIWKPTKIETLLAEIGEYSLIYSPAVEYIHKDGFITKVPNLASYFDWCSRFGTGKVTKQLIASNWVVSHQLMFKKELCGFALPIPADQPYHDAWLAVVASKLGGIKFLSSDLMIYRQHEESFTYQNHSHLKSKKDFFHCFLQKFNLKSPKQEAIRVEICRLKNVLSFSLLEASDKEFIYNLMYCYERRLNRGVHFKSFLISIKYRNFFINNKNKIDKIKFSMKFLIGQI